MKFLLVVLALLYLTWVHYVAVMGLQGAQAAGKLTPLQRAFGIVTLGIGLALDFLLHVTVGTLLFLDLPREFLLTQRLVRHKRAGAGWRFRLACWLCTNLLDSLDPQGCHCRT